MKIAAIYLAGGNSKRMGVRKVALPVGTMTLGSIALETILKTSIQTVYVIVQAADEVDWLPPQMKADPKCTIIHCENAHLEQSETLRCGILQAMKDDMDAVIIFLADQPFITIQVIDNMIACVKQSPSSQFVANSYDETIYPPVLFTKEMFEALLTIEGDYGAKALLKGNILKAGKCLQCEDKRLVFDIDTKEDYKQLLSSLDGDP